MKKAFTYTLRAIALIVGITAGLLLIGEPTDQTFFEVVMVKAGALLAILLMVKLYLCTLSDREREEFENEQA